MNMTHKHKSTSNISRSKSAKMRKMALSSCLSQCGAEVYSLNPAGHASEGLLSGDHSTRAVELDS